MPSRTSGEGSVMAIRSTRTTSARDLASKSFETRPCESCESERCLGLDDGEESIVGGARDSDVVLVTGATGAGAEVLDGAEGWAGCGAAESPEAEEKDELERRVSELDPGTRLMRDSLRRPPKADVRNKMIQDKSRVQCDRN